MSKGILVRVELLTRAFLSAPFFLQAQSYNVPPVRAAIDLNGQRVQIAGSGSISVTAGNAQQLNINIDLGDLQEHLTAVLAAELDRSDKCGEQLMVEHATLLPAAPSGVMTVNLHYERYACGKAFGREIAKKLMGGNGVVVLKVTPQVADSNISVDSEVQKMDADGSLGRLLRSGNFGDSLKQDIGDSIESAIQKLADTKATLPAAIQNAVTIQTIRFADGGAGRLSLDMTGTVQLAGDQVRRAVGK